MPDGDFFHIKSTEGQRAENFINLAAISKVDWDGTEAHICLLDGREAFASGQSAERLLAEIRKRCVAEVRNPNT